MSIYLVDALVVEVSQLPVVFALDDLAKGSTHACAWGKKWSETLAKSCEGRGFTFIWPVLGLAMLSFIAACFWDATLTPR